MHDYGKAKSFDELDKRIGNVNFPVAPTKCPKCETEGWPETLLFYDDYNKKPMFTQTIGGETLPVVGGKDTPYGYNVSPEEQAEYERGLAKIKENFSQEEDVFWDRYCNFAISKWQQIIKEISIEEFVQGYKKMELPLLPRTATTTVWRKEVFEKFKKPLEQTRAWKAFNKFLVEGEFIWCPIDSWPMKEFLKKYGRERVVYLTLHIPLPEELEKWRTIKLSQIIRKQSGETGILFERIGQLGKELEKQHKKSSLLGTRNIELQQKVSEQKREIQELSQQKQTIVHRDPNDIWKIKQLKSLVKDMYEEIARLTPEEAKETIEKSEQEKTPLIEHREEKVDFSVLKGKTVGIFGWPRKTVENKYCKTIYHDGDTADIKLASLVREADILVVLTKYIAHKAMWKVKELAVDYDKPVYFLKETNLDRILAIVAKAIGNG